MGEVVFCILEELYGKSSSAWDGSSINEFFLVIAKRTRPSQKLAELGGTAGASIMEEDLRLEPLGWNWWPFNLIQSWGV